MRASLESRLNEVWYRAATPPWYLRALEPAYRALFSFDQKRQSRRRAGDLGDKCIIVVGNITAGGSGKTPLLIRLCEVFVAAGLSPAVISRGYGRQDKRQHRVKPDSDPAMVGDEPLLIARRSGVPVAVGPDRAELARQMFAQGADLVLSDDGLQHSRLPRALEICVVDGQRGFGNGHLLPAGPLREPATRLHSVSHVVINGGEPERLPGGEALQGVDWTRMDVHARRVRAVGENLSWRLAQFAGCRVSAVAGIANPHRFFDLLRHARIEVTEHVFPDHHQFRSEDFAALPADLPVIMTEKDAVKCMSLELENAWFVCIDAQLPAHWEAALVAQARRFINDN